MAESNKGFEFGIWIKNLGLNSSKQMSVSSIEFSP